MRGGGGGEEGETETATEGEDEGEGGGRVWSLECGGWRVRGPLVAGARVGLIACGVVRYHRLTETGECGAGDSLVLVVVLKRRTTQDEGA